jgi:hypothetical protein
MNSVPSPWFSFAIDALAALGTVGAAMLALMLALRDNRRTSAAEAEYRAERVRQRTAAHRAQAERVTAWIVMPPGPQSDPQRYAAIVELSNTSMDPIYEAKIHIHREGGEGGFLYVGFVAPNDKWHGHAPAPGDLVTGAAEPIVAIFRDAAGNWWTRDDRGVLIEHDRDPAPRPS